MSQNTLLRQARLLSRSRNLTTSSTRLQANPPRVHPLARPCGPRPSPSSSASSGPSGGDGAKAGNTPQWSNATALLLATLTGASMYVWGRQSAQWSGDGAQSSPKTPQKPTRKGFESALGEVKKVLPEDCISVVREDLQSHASSDWSYHDVHCLPGVVFYPRSTEDVVQIVKIASKFCIPIVPISGGTSLEGHFNAPYYPSDPSETAPQGKKRQEELKPGLSFVVDFSENMDNIIEINEKDLDVVVQPGVKYEVLNSELKERGTGLFFPVDPGPGAEIGGMVATGCSGTNAVRYGTMRENVLNLTVVLPSGEVIKTRQRAKKSAAGPDLGRLFIGAEGTLGLVTEATLKLSPALPYSVAVASFPSVQAAADTVADMVHAGIGVQCVELLDDVMMKAVNKKGVSDGKRKWDERPSLFIKFAGTEGQIKSDTQHTADLVKKYGGAKLIFAKSEQEKEDLWYARKVALWSAIDYVPGSRCWTTDVCVPISKLPQLVHETKDDLSRSNLIAPIVGHVGDGNFHALILFTNDEEFERAKGAVHRMVERAQRLGGTCTGEHGVGIGKQEYLEYELGRTVDLLRGIKKLVDPQNIMNPGKLIPPETKR